MKIYLSLLLTFILFLLPALSSAQGCSDAGVCSVGSLGLTGQFKYEYLPQDEITLLPMPANDPDSDTINNTGDSTFYPTTIAVIKPPTPKPKEPKKYSYRFPKYFFQLSSAYGKGDEGVNIITTQLEGNVRIGKKTFAQIKLPYSFINGQVANTQGLNDITLSVTYIAFIREKSNWTATGGVKLPTNNSNILKDGAPLPMVYQTSLGSIDALGGVKYSIKKWDFTIGYQHSFNANKNEYLHKPLVNDTVAYNNYFESKFLRRADDAIFRFNRNFFYKTLRATGGFLFIYHLADDKFTNAKNEVVNAKGSRGLTLNVNLSGTVPLSKKLDLNLIYASPIVTREVRPDGLTRKYVASIGLKYSIY